MREYAINPDASRRAKIHRLELLYEILHRMALGQGVTIETLADIAGTTIRQAERLLPGVLEASEELGVPISRQGEDLEGRWVFSIGEADPESAKQRVHETIRLLQDRARDPAIYSERYFALKDMGLCRCKRPLKPGYSTCGDCEAASKGAQKDRFKQRRRKRQCLFCGEPARPGSTRCERCIADAVRRSADDRAERAEAGLCRTCDQPSQEGSFYCRVCAEKNTSFSRDRAERLAEAGLCRTCAKAPALPNQKMCAHCLERHKSLAASRYQRLRQAGLCIMCMKPARPGKAHCDSCAEIARQKARLRREKS